MMGRFIRSCVLLGLASLTSGCVVGQHLRLDSTPASTSTVGGGAPVVIVVEDQRIDVTSGKEKPWRIGQYRAGLGNPWDVTTEGKVPLAKQLEADLVEELESLGFVPGTVGSTTVVLIRQWDFTGYQNGRFWYELEVSVYLAPGQPIASVTLAEELEIQGTLALGAMGGFERDMPEIYARIVRSMVRENPPILAALSQKQDIP